MSLSKRGRRRPSARAVGVWGTALGLGLLCWGCGARGGQTGDEVVHSGSSTLDGSKLATTQLGDQVEVTGSAGATSSGATVTVVNNSTGARGSVIADSDGSFVVSIAAEAGDELDISVGDSHVLRVAEAAGETTSDTASDTSSAALAPDAATEGSLAACDGLTARRAVEPTAGQCSAALHLLGCSYDDGSRAICLSDATDACPDLPDDFTGCESNCAEGEYALACGGLNPMADYEEPPESCTSAGATPGGVVYYCCPCVP